MYLYYDRYGTLKEQITFNPARVGNSNVNKIFVYWEGVEEFPDWAQELALQTRYLLQDNTQYPSATTFGFSAQPETAELPFDKNQDLKYFKYYKEYKFLTIDIPDEVLSYNGAVKSYIWVLNADKKRILGLGVFAFMVDGDINEVIPDENISLAQWNMISAQLGLLSGSVIDVTCDIATNTLKVYYANGLTAIRNLPPNGAQTTISSDFLREMIFSADTWVQDGENGYYTYFRAETVGYTDNRFFVQLEKDGEYNSDYYNKTGSFVLSDNIFKGSDGSVLLYSNEPYSGRLLLVGGKLLSGDSLVTGLIYNPENSQLTYKTADGITHTIYLGIEQKLNISDITQTTGDSTVKVMSQKAVGMAIDEAIVTNLRYVSNDVFHEEFVTSITNNREFSYVEGAALRLVAATNRAALTPTSYPRKLTLMPNTDYKIRIFYTDSNGIYTHNTSWLIDSITLDANTYFGMLLARTDNVAMNNSELTDGISTFLEPENIVNSLGTNENDVISQFGVTSLLEQQNATALQLMFNTRYVNNSNFNYSIGSTLNKIKSTTRATMPAYVYDNNVIISANSGYNFRIFYLDSDLVLERYSNYDSTPKKVLQNQMFAIALGRADNAQMTAEELQYALTIEHVKIINDDFTWQNLRQRFNAENVMVAYSTGAGLSVINTEYAYVYAAILGFKWLKGDVQPTSDGHLIMCHDAGFTFDGNGYITSYDSANCTLIHNLTYAQCKALQHATTVGDVHPNVCGLEDYLRICRDYGARPYITIRDDYMNEVVPELLNLISFYGFTEHCIVNSFNTESLRRVAEASNHKVMISQVKYFADGNYPTKQLFEQLLEISPNCTACLYSSTNNNNALFEGCHEVLDYARSKKIMLGTAGSFDTSLMSKYGINLYQNETPNIKPVPFVVPLIINITSGTALLTSKRAIGATYTADVSVSGNHVYLNNIRFKNSSRNFADAVPPDMMWYHTYNVRAYGYGGADVVQKCSVTRWSDTPAYSIDIELYDINTDCEICVVWTWG